MVAVNWLGAETDSDIELAEQAENGLPTDVVQIMAEHGLTMAEVSALVIPPRTLKHRRSRHEPLSREESGGAIRAARILTQAQMVFGDKDMALQWMREPKIRFSGRTPMRMLETETGGRLIEEMLLQIEHGMFA